MLLQELEAAVFVPAKAVIAIAQLGEKSPAEQALIFNDLKDYNCIPYRGGTSESSTLTKSSARSKTHKTTGVNIRWIEKHLYAPALTIILTSLSPEDRGEMDELLDSIRAINADCARRGIKSLLLLSPSGSAHVNIQEVNERISRSTNVPSSSIFLLAESQLPMIRSFVSLNYDRYYKECIKRYRKRMYALEEGPERVPIYASLRYQFKIAYMELLLGDRNGALRTFNDGYSEVVEHYRRLDRSEDQIAFLDSVKWMCDVIALKIVSILLTKNEKYDADEYFSGHICWLTAAHGSQVELLRWKVTLYDAMSKLLMETVSISPSFAKWYGDQRHAGYYLLQAARNAITLQSIIPSGMASLEDTQKTIWYLDQALSEYSRSNHSQGHIIQIHRLRVSQYLSSQNVNTAKE